MPSFTAKAGLFCPHPECVSSTYSTLWDEGSHICYLLMAPQRSKVIARDLRQSVRSGRKNSNSNHSFCTARTKALLLLLADFLQAMGAVLMMVASCLSISLQAKPCGPALWQAANPATALQQQPQHHMQQLIATCWAICSTQAGGSPSVTVMQGQSCSFHWIQ